MLQDFCKFHNFRALKYDDNSFFGVGLGLDKFCAAVTVIHTVYAC